VPFYFYYNENVYFWKFIVCLHIFEIAKPSAEQKARNDRPSHCHREERSDEAISISFFKNEISTPALGWLTMIKNRL
jgi:hypothetical protein